MLRPALDSTLAPTIAIATAAGGKRGNAAKLEERGRREGDAKQDSRNR
jgi:hypothetical protein